jgi:5-methylthioribose kinase
LTAALGWDDIERMRVIDEQSAADYLRETSRIGSDEAVRVSELAGGVSNMVLLVESLDHPGREFVVKQARPQLRTRQAWFSSVERVWREAEVLAICTRLLAGGAAEITVAQTPRILFEDRDNYLFAMTAAPRPNTTWKQSLLAGRVDPRIAADCGRLLGTLHAGSWLDSSVAGQIGDSALFDQLRVDPYYRTLAVVHPEISAELNALIDSMAAHRCSLVHADFSPKNLLVYSGGLMMVDFETGHYGDPAFDLGFFLSHLVLKACQANAGHAAYLDLSSRFHLAYCETIGARIGAPELAQLWSRGVRHFAACAWARLDGKSPVDYLHDPSRRELMRGICRAVFDGHLQTWPQVIALCEEHFST